MHHAYITYGNHSLLPALRQQVVDDYNLKPFEIEVRSYEKFGIEDAKDLILAASLRNVSKKKAFVVGVSLITTEAQQALLKLFEEPQEGTTFFLLAPQGVIISTLQSRVLSYSMPALLEDYQNVALSVKKFLTSSYTYRSTEVTKLLKDEEGIRDRVRVFLYGLENELYKSISKDIHVRTALEDIAKVRSYANDRSPAMKMLLEHLALSLPTVK